MTRMGTVTLLLEIPIRNIHRYAYHVKSCLACDKFEKHSPYYGHCKCLDQLVLQYKYDTQYDHIQVLIVRLCHFLPKNIIQSKNKK